MNVQQIGLVGSYLKKRKRKGDEKKEKGKVIWQESRECHRFKGSREMEPSFQKLLSLHFLRGGREWHVPFWVFEISSYNMAGVKFAMETIKEPGKKGFDSIACPKEPGERTKNTKVWVTSEWGNRCFDRATIPDLGEMVAGEDCISVTKEVFQKDCLVCLWIHRDFHSTVCAQTYNCWAYECSGEPNQLWASWGKATCLRFISFVFASYLGR